MAISLGMIVMLIAIATGDGLREKIRSKISGFKGHIQITKYDANNSDVSVIPIDKNQNFYPKFTNIKGVKNIQIYANQVGLIRTKNDFEGIDKKYPISFEKIIRMYKNVLANGFTSYAEA